MVTKVAHCDQIWDIDSKEKNQKGNLRLKKMQWEETNNFSDKETKCDSKRNVNLPSNENI